LEGKTEMKAFASHDVMTEFLRFIYCEKVNSMFIIAGDLLAIAKKYEIHALKNSCCKSLMDNLTVNNAAKIANIADENQAEELRNLCVTFIAK
jgi:hypothetical protein